MAVEVRIGSEDYVSGDVTVHLQAAVDDAGTAYWVVSGSCDLGDYAHSVTDQAQAQAFAAAVASALDARAQALAAFSEKMTALFGDDVTAAVAAFVKP